MNMSQKDFAASTGKQRGIAVFLNERSEGRLRLILDGHTPFSSTIKEFDELTRLGLRGRLSQTPFPA